MTTPKRVQLRRKKGWRMPAGTVKVDRTAVFGNPFVPGQPNGLGWGEVRDTAHAVWLYRRWITTPHRSIAFERTRHLKVLKHLPALAGKDLACWCTAGGTCHADVLLDLANRPNITALAQALITGDDVPWTADEAATAMAQLTAATGGTPADVGRVASTITALAADRLTPPAGPPDATTPADGEAR